MESSTPFRAKAARATAPRLLSREAPRWPFALGAALLIAGLFPIGVWRALNSVRRIQQSESFVIEIPNDYPRAVAWLNAGTLVFLILLMIVLVLAVRSAVARDSMWRTRGIFSLGALTLVAVQTISFVGAFVATERALPPLTTNGWRPARIAPGTEVTVIPTASQDTSNGAGVRVVWDARDVPLRDPLPRDPVLATGLGPLLGRLGVERALDSRRRTEEIVFFGPFWNDPHSTFDAPHGDKPLDTFRMTPRLLRVRTGERIDYRWAGEYHLIAGPHRSGPVDRL